jgi:hypothetical protein
MQGEIQSKSGNIAADPLETRAAVIIPFPKQFSSAALTSKSGLSVTLLRNENIEDPTWAFPFGWYWPEEVPASLMIHVRSLRHNQKFYRNKSKPLKD